MELPENIEILPDVMLGKPCLKGTRIPFHLILEKLAAGESAEVILEAYSQLAKRDTTAPQAIGDSHDRRTSPISRISPAASRKLF